MKKRMFTVLFGALLLLFNQTNTYASTPIKPTIQKCDPYINYTESSVNTREEIQFSHISSENELDSIVTFSTKLTSTLSLKTGLSVDMNIFLAKTSMSFELQFIGSKESTIELTWNVPRGKKYKLVAGKRIADVSGMISEKDEDCRITDKPIRVEGSYETFHESMRVN